MWTGNDDCKPIEIEECHLVDVEKTFIKKETVCTKADALIPWTDCESVTKSQITSAMTCSPRTALECKPVTNNHCITG